MRRIPYWFITIILVGALLAQTNLVTPVTILPLANLSATGILRFRDLHGHNVGFRSIATSANTTWILPGADAAGSLNSDGAGNLSFGASTLSYNGHTLFTSTPIISGCTGALDVNSTNSDTAFTIVITVAATSCVATFGTSFTKDPTCVTSDSGAATFSNVSAVSNAAITISLSALFSGKVYVHCF